MDKQPSAAERATPSPLCGSSRDLVARSGAALQQQRAEAKRLLAGLRETYQQARHRHDEEVEALQRRLADCERDRDEARQRCQAAEAQVEQLEQSQHEIVAQAEAALHEQHEELARVLAELRDLGAAAGAAPCETPHPEESDWRQRLEQREKELAEVRHQAKKLAGNLEQCEEALYVARERAETAEEKAERLDELERELAALRRQLQERETQVSQFRALEHRPASASENEDIAAYEAELVEYHRQLEADRAALNEEIEQLRARNQELTAAARKAREQLDRERDEVRGEHRLDRAFADLAEREQKRAQEKNDGKLVPKLRLKEAAS